MILIGWESGICICPGRLWRCLRGRQGVIRPVCCCLHGWLLHRRCPACDHGRRLPGGRMDTRHYGSWIWVKSISIFRIKCCMNESSRDLLETCFSETFCFEVTLINSKLKVFDLFIYVVRWNCFTTCIFMSVF